MPTTTYIPLANVTLSASAASVTFSSISQAYRDLVLVMQTTSSNAAGGGLRINGDTAGNYSSVWAYGSGSATGSSTYTGSYFYLQGMFAGTVSIDRFEFLDYSATDKHKTVLNRLDSPTGQGTYMTAGRWASTSAVTSITLIPFSAGTFAAGSTFALYGVSA